MFLTDQVAMYGAPWRRWGNSSVTVPWRLVESVIGVYAECVVGVVQTHFSEAAMLNIHLYAGVKLGFVMWGSIFFLINH